MCSVCKLWTRSFLTTTMASLGNPILLCLWRCHTSTDRRYIEASAILETHNRSGIRQDPWENLQNKSKNRYFERDIHAQRLWSIYVLGNTLHWMMCQLNQWAFEKPQRCCLGVAKEFFTAITNRAVSSRRCKCKKNCNSRCHNGSGYSCRNK